MLFRCKCAVKAENQLVCCFLSWFRTFSVSALPIMDSVKGLKHRNSEYDAIDALMERKQDRNVVYLKLCFNKGTVSQAVK